MSKRKKALTYKTKISPWRQASIFEGRWAEMRWHYNHGRGWVNNGWSRIRKDGKIRRVKPPWKIPPVEMASKPED